jgi:DHA2 family methylenomycin A resistance protein-like MFS transporter
MRPYWPGSRVRRLRELPSSPSKRASRSRCCRVTMNVAFYGLFFVLSLYFQSVRHYSVLAAGLAFGPTVLAVFAGNLLAGRFADRRHVIASGAALVAVGVVGLVVASPTTPFVAVTVQLAALGLGLGLIVPAMTSAILGSVDATRSGVASGTLNTARQTGSVVGVALFGSFAATGVVDGLRLALVVSLALAVVTIALSRGVSASASDGDVRDREQESRTDEAQRDDDPALEAGCEVA